MNRRLFARTGASLLAASLALAARRARAAPARAHRVALQVSLADPALMNLALSNVANIAEAYAARGEAVAIELVAYGPGYAMLRADTSPVAARVADIRARLPFVVFSACQNARRGMAHAEGKKPEQIPELPGVTDVPAGVVRLVTLQEQGWSYIRP
ncbi:MAG: DsrE family protein [Janthinobacterium lividum]